MISKLIDKFGRQPCCSKRMTLRCAVDIWVAANKVSCLQNLSLFVTNFDESIKISTYKISCKCYVIKIHINVPTELSTKQKS